MPKLVRGKVELRKGRAMRLSDKTWKGFAVIKPRDKSWEQFISELLEIINTFKKL